MEIKKYKLFLDETGDHGLSFVDESFPMFSLVGCLFESTEYDNIVDEIGVFKEEFFKTTEVILHSRDIRKCDGAFQILFDMDLKKRFYENLNKIIENSSFKIIAVAIHKKKYIEKYGTIAQNPYAICLSYILERLIYCTDSKTTVPMISITIEKRGKKEDAQLLAYYNSILDKGTDSVGSNRFKERILEFKMKLKKDNDVGLQIADLCAYPIARYVLNSKEPYIPFNVIESKLRSRTNGNKDSYELKVFP